MIYIAHRGNINGSNFSKENHPDYLKEALKLGYHAELDVWFINNKFILGHDKPQYEVDKHFLSNNKFWVHAKNIETLHILASSGNLIHYFFHSADDATLTSKGWIWTYPGRLVGHSKSVAVMPESVKIKPSNLYFSGAICTDYPEKYKNMSLPK